MSDPRQPIFRPDTDAQAAIRAIVQAHLFECTDHGTRALRCSGASFVTMGIAMWAAELAELDPRAATQYLAALAVIFDPAASPAKKGHAERRRGAAVDRLLAAVDLFMATAGGRA